MNRRSFVRKAICGASAPLLAPLTCLGVSNASGVVLIAKKGHLVAGLDPAFTKESYSYFVVKVGSVEHRILLSDP